MPSLPGVSPALSLNRWIQDKGLEHAADEDEHQPEGEQDDG